MNIKDPKAISSPRIAGLVMTVIPILTLFFPGCGPARYEGDLRPFIVEAWSSSNESRRYPAALAADGDTSTRWASAFEDDEWITFGFDRVVGITEITIRWETACPAEYRVEASEDGESWEGLVERNDFRGGNDAIELDREVPARYLRIVTGRRATEWGNSIFEVEPNGTAPGEPPEESLIGFTIPPTERDLADRAAAERLLAEAAADPPVSDDMTDDELLDLIERRAFLYFLHETKSENGLTRDRGRNFSSSEEIESASTAAVGFALTAWCIGAERGWLPREEAVERVRTTLAFFESGGTPNIHGFYYHFIDLETGEPDPGSEISTIDTTLFLCGVITAMEYFDDAEISRLGSTLVERTDWAWSRDGHPYFPSHGLAPDGSFLSAHWGTTTEGILAYIVGLGTPERGLPPGAWDAFDRHLGEYNGHRFGIEYAAQSIFRYQYPCLWYDLRGKHDRYLNYFENGREAVRAMRDYCIENADRFPESYNENLWGLGAADGPGNEYRIYGFPPGVPEAPVDGTVVVYAAAGSVIFLPDESISAMRTIYDEHHETWGKYGFADSFNPSEEFVARDVIALDQGTIMIAIENHRTGLVWDAFGSSSYIEAATNIIDWTEETEATAWRPVGNGSLLLD